MNASTELVTLLNMLEDEFRKFEEVRVRPVFKSGTERSYDLEQDYDSETNDVHLRSGVRVSTGKREYFFPEEWIAARKLGQIREQIEEILDYLG